MTSKIFRFKSVPPDDIRNIFIVKHFETLIEIMPIEMGNPICSSQSENYIVQLT